MNRTKMLVAAVGTAAVGAAAMFSTCRVRRAATSHGACRWADPGSR
jgi:hypothetical protein